MLVGSAVISSELSRSLTHRKDCAVLIVGGGPTGLMLACELARRGVTPRVVEAAPGPQRGSRGKGVQPRSLEVFANLGIVEKVIAHGRMNMPVRSTGPDGKVTSTGGEPLCPRPDVPYPASLITPEWRIEEALRERLEALGGRVEFGSALEDFVQLEHGVAARVSGASGVETIQADWLIGCDGGHSRVRKHAGIAFEGETLEDVRMIVADLQVEGLARDAWHLWRHAEGFAALCPLPSTEVFQYQASIAPGQDASLALENLQAILDRRSGRDDMRLHRVEWQSLWRANIRLVDRYRAGRVLLAGDAAHIHSPAGGQGMNTGIQDAHNLGWKLAAVVAGASPALLDTYEQERRPVAAAVLALSNERLRRVVEQKGIPVHRDASTSQLGISYRDGPLAHDDRNQDSRLRAGDRAPDAASLETLEGERRLFDLMRGAHFTLLDFGARSEVSVPGLRTLRIVARASGADDVVDAAGHLAGAYGPGSRTLVLVRPDGYIAVISDAGDQYAVTAYLHALGLGVSL